MNMNNNNYVLDWCSWLLGDKSEDKNCATKSAYQKFFFVAHWFFDN